MATVIFYEKPGCINNAKQKALLKSAGHQVQSYNLLTEAWTAEHLRSFFGTLPVAEWFNPSAPSVKSGEIRPKTLPEEAALRLMIQNPLLIRRPLMEISQQKSVGFDPDAVDAWIGLEPMDANQRAISNALKQQDLQTCPRAQRENPCPVPL